MRRLHGLAVDDCRRGSGVAPFVNPHLFAKRVMHRRQRTVLAPTSEVLPNQAPRREIMRKVAPLAPRTRLVEDRVPDLPPLVLGRATSLALLGGRFARDDQLPLCSRQVRVISRPSRTYLPFHTNYYPANNNLSLHALSKPGGLNWDWADDHIRGTVVRVLTTRLWPFSGCVAGDLL